tara:strand:+ start:1532 stop:1915 length:384 start_codon:yes stop_codon:yes gene_type:complete
MKLLNGHLKQTSDIINYVKSWSGHQQPYHIKKHLLLTKYIGTLDKALTRFNTLLLRLNEHPLLLAEHVHDLDKCSKIIRNFYINTKRLDTWPMWLRRFLVWNLHRLGTKQIPFIKKLHDKVLTKIND